ncbi:hypothetical protein [Nonomuraea typhae]|uniref:Uncharacterized protein n=1 Tax=Nonomuraea typhae TaxID=2603600 RepID=A0ABW7ZCA8_9ACTN
MPNVVPEDLHDFFFAAAGVAGALIGLLFVVISVSAERIGQDGSQLHRIQASVALTAFTNALVVSLFALVPGDDLGSVALVVAIIGLLSVAASLLSLIRLRQRGWRSVRDSLFLAGLAVAFGFQMSAGMTAVQDPAAPDPIITIAYLVVVCFLIGIGRSWELVGAPQIGIIGEVFAMFRRRPPGPR